MEYKKYTRQELIRFAVSKVNKGEKAKVELEKMAATPEEISKANDELIEYGRMMRTQESLRRTGQ